MTDMIPQLEDWLQKATQQIETGIKDVYITKGKMDALLEFGGRQLSGVESGLTALAGQVAVQSEALTHMTRLIFGDARTLQSPSIRKDIDRHDQEISELRENIAQLTELNKQTLVAVGKLTDEVFALKSQIKPVVYLFTLLRSAPGAAWEGLKEFGKNRWLRILIPVGGALLAILIEYLRSIGVIQ